MTSFLTNSKSFPIIIGLLVICSILTLNFNTFYWADDYSVLNEINALGVYQRCIMGYYTWDGRYLTPAAFLQGTFLKLLPVKIITLFWNCCFLASGILLFFIIKVETKYKFVCSVKIYLPILISIIFWLGSYSHISQTIYWATGGVYSFNLILGAIWVLLFYKIQKRNHLVFKICFLIFTIFIGLTTQNLTIGLITLILLTILNAFLKNESKNIKFNVIVFLIIIAGTVFLSTAPGNFIRINEINSSAFRDITLEIIIRNFAFTLATYLKLSFFLIFLSVLAGFVFINQSNNRISLTIQNIVFIPKTKEQFIVFIDINKYLIVALSTILPFITMPEVVSPRTAVYFMFFLVIFMFRFITQISVIQMNLNENTRTSVIAYTLFSAAFCFIIYNFCKGHKLNTEITKRELLLKNSRNKTVSIKKIDEKLKSYCYDFRDFRGNDDWALEAQRIYFGIKKINVIE